MSPKSRGPLSITQPGTDLVLRANQTRVCNRYVQRDSFLVDSICPVQMRKASIQVMPAIAPAAVWSQELQVHWPPSWRFLGGRDVLLEAFAPKVFTVADEILFLRYGENQDLRVSEYGMHLRILALEPNDSKAREVFDKVVQVMKPDSLNNIEATFSHVYELKADYDQARRDLSHVFYQSWTRQRPMKDFALLWDEDVQPDSQAHFKLGVVDQDELIDRVAMASGTAPKVLHKQLPAWMKVRRPRVSIFMHSRYESEQSVAPDVGRVHVPQTWREWRERSDQLFGELTGLAVPATSGDAL